MVSGRASSYARPHAWHRGKAHGCRHHLLSGGVHRLARVVSADERKRSLSDFASDPRQRNDLVADRSHVVLIRPMSGQGRASEKGGSEAAGVQSAESGPVPSLSDTQSWMRVPGIANARHGRLPNGLEVVVLPRSVPMSMKRKRSVKDVLTAVSRGRKLGKLGEVCGLRAQGERRCAVSLTPGIGTEAEPWPSLTEPDHREASIGGAVIRRCARRDAPARASERPRDSRVR